MGSRQRINRSETIDYYEKNASAFIESTINADVSELYKQFEAFLFPGCRILDLGCGSGRDSRYFSERGFDVVAIDPSSAMCEQTRSIVDIPVFEMGAEDMPFSDEFDAVWACASLLHVPRDKQHKALTLIREALKEDGICYCSWKYGDHDRIAEGRHFTDFNENSFRSLLEQNAGLEEIRIWITHDVRADRKDQKWLNVLLRKTAAGSEQKE